MSEAEKEDHYYPKTQEGNAEESFTAIHKINKKKIE